MKSRIFSYYGAVATAAIVLAACGGGGNSAPSPPSGYAGAGGTTSETASATIRTRITGSALSVLGASVNISALAQPQGAVLFGFQQALSIRGLSGLIAAASPICNNGVETSWSSSAGVFSNTLEIFYDSACANPYLLKTLSVTPPSGSSGTGTATGTEEVWNASGAPVSYKTDAYSFTIADNQITQVTQQRSAAQAPGASPYARYGFTCVFTSGQPVDCGTGNAINIASVSESVGFTETTTGSFGSASPTPSSGGSPAPSPSGPPVVVPLYIVAKPLQLTIAGTGYTGALGGLTLTPGTVPAWSITGGTQAVTLNGTISAGFSRPSLLTDANLRLNDSADGLSVTLASSNGGRLTGSITNASGQTVGTIALDLSGSGQVSYSDGTTAQVRDWVIL